MINMEYGRVLYSWKSATIGDTRIADLHVLSLTSVESAVGVVERASRPTGRTIILAFPRGVLYPPNF